MLCNSYSPTRQTYIIHHYWYYITYFRKLTNVLILILPIKSVRSYMPPESMFDCYNVYYFICIHVQLLVLINKIN